jgi:hypothetical protein
MKKIIGIFYKLGNWVINFWNWSTDKIKSSQLLLGLIGNIVGLAIWLKKKIFWESTVSRRARIIRIIGVVIVVLVILALVAWYVYSKFNDQDQNKYLAEAKVYVVTTRACGQKCWDTNVFLDALKNRGVKVVKVSKAYYGWLPFSLGNRLVSELKIEKLPTVVVELTGKDKPDSQTFFGSDSGRVINDKFVLTKILAPYFDIEEKKIKGLIDVTYLKDSTCSECYDVSRHQQAFKNFGIYPRSIKTVEVSSSEGQALIKKYSITKVPTLLISGEVSEYQVLNFVWGDLGIISSDGTYIFTNVDLMGDSYKDLTTGRVIKADASKATSQ